MPGLVGDCPVRPRVAELDPSIEVYEKEFAAVRAGKQSALTRRKGAYLASVAAAPWRVVLSLGRSPGRATTCAWIVIAGPVPAPRHTLSGRSR